MDKDKIDALAKEYAEKAAKGIDLPNCLSQEAVNMLSEDMAQKITWLLRSHCIVRKEEIKYYRDQAYVMLKSSPTGFWEGQKCLLDSVFGEE